MLSLRELIAQQSQESIDTTVQQQSQESSSVQQEEINPSRRDNDGSNNSTTTVLSSPKLELDQNDNIWKRKAKAIQVSPPRHGRKRIKPNLVEEIDDDDNDESSQGEEWFGDDDDDIDNGGYDDAENDHVDRNVAFQELSKSLPQALSAIYSHSSSSFPHDKTQQLSILNRALHSKHKSVTFQSRVERLQPRTKQVRKRYSKNHIETETVEEARERVLRRDRDVERYQVAQRWQNRKINYTLEKDVNNVFGYRVHRVLARKFKQQERQKHQAIRDQQQRELQIKQEERQRGLVDYDSEDEQNQLLDRLTQNSAVSETIQTQEEEDMAEQEIKDPSIPLKDQMDFWEYGKAYPSKEDLAEFDYEKLFSFQPVQTLAELAEQAKINKLTPAERRIRQSQTMSISAFLKMRPEKKTETPSPRYFFPNSHGSTETLDQFGHIRHFRAIAMRQLSSRSLSESTENRLIRALLVKRNHGRIKGPVADFSSLPTYKTMTHQLAANLLLYHEHSWTDPELVAEHLGLTGDLAGFTGTAVQVVDFFKARRDFCKKHYLRGKKDLIEEKTNGTIANGTDETLRDQSDNAQTKEVGSFGELLPSSSLFAHIPGTKAPVPEMPLEPAAMLFGPVDKHAKFFHKSKIGETTSRLIVSTFLCRMAKQHSSDTFASGEASSNPSEDLKAFMEEYVQIHSSKTSNFFGRMHGMVNVANVHYYKSLMSYCSLLANGCPLPASTNEAIKVEDREDDDMYATEGVCKQAREIVSVLQSHVGCAEVAKFPRLRIVFSLAQIASSLPESAADILSQAVDGEQVRTPLDLFKQTLEHMEEREMIVSQKDFPDDDTVDVGNLEYLFFQASKTLQENIQVDALDLDHHLWYIGALASCLLLCSGNRIGGGAHMYPSRKSRMTFYGYSKSLPHEVRYKLPKFDDMRQALSSAIKMLFQLASYQKGSKVHLAVCSLLDWKEVVALLAGDSGPSKCDDICRLYSHHAKKWALSDQSWKSGTTSTTLEKKDHAFETELLARQLENRPGTIEVWRKFVQKLGPLGHCENGTAPDESTTDCPPRDDCIVNHSKDWWGSSRKWWIGSLLHMDSLKIARRWKPYINGVIEKLEEPSNMPECAPYVPHFPEHDDYDTVKSLEETWTSWLPLETIGLHTNKCEGDRATCFDDKLPDRTVPRNSSDMLEDMEQKEEEDTEFRLPSLGPSTKEPRPRRAAASKQKQVQDSSDNKSESSSSSSEDDDDGQTQASGESDSGSDDDGDSSDDDSTYAHE
ncbi:unnamed protein product [Cylindrotheca closterium]|uniref:Uncharacterized protein n=1 Tax=Cylindrotheca closterium TaxID=2856 RepID=A0AAD2GC09_9STRA|nr:unnamed protein product [Cylindrotheca closterium]